jgi:hypothetical protein
MSDPTKVIVYVALQGTWLTFADEDGVPTLLDLPEPMRLVAERDYAKLAQDVATLRAERDALRAQWSGMLIEQARLMAMRDAAIAERDKLRTVDDAMVERFLRAYTECEDERPWTFTHRIGVRAALDAALAVQPTTSTGETQ